jgi:hypothetical protein
MDRKALLQPCIIGQQYVDAFSKIAERYLKFFVIYQPEDLNTA